MSRFPASAALVAAGAIALAAAPAASAAPSTLPVVTKFAPKTVKAGQRLTVSGRNFRKGRNKNTVIFLGRRGPTVFVKADRATTKKLSLVLPARVDQALDLANGAPATSRLRIRVVSRRPARRFTTLSRSPIVVPFGGTAGSGLGAAPTPEGDCDGDGSPNGQDGDDDNDLLSDGLEAELKTDACRADTDGDALTDGWEYFSARDLNADAVPFPGRRPFPNALDPSDAGADHDGDFLSASDEYRAWVATGRAFDGSKPGSESPLGYSDGTQSSSGREAPAAPAYSGAGSNLAGFDPVFLDRSQFGAGHFDLDGDSRYTDDERDADRDGLGNQMEIGGPMKESFWKAFLSKAQVKPWKDAKRGEDPQHGVFEQRPFASVDFLDGDSDGDRLLDGEDDQDNDDVANVNEAYQFVYFEVFGERPDVDRDGTANRTDGDVDGDGVPNGQDGDIDGDQAVNGFDLDADGDGEGNNTDGDLDGDGVPNAVDDEDAAATSQPANVYNPCAPIDQSRTCPLYKPLG